MVVVVVAVAVIIPSSESLVTVHERFVVVRACIDVPGGFQTHTRWLVY